jgi:oligopeptide/dipeptide ABC transporter ATP-binding protein
VPGRLSSIPGSVVPLQDSARGCSFQPRCHLAIDACGAEKPELRGAAHLAACHRELS